MDKQSLEIIHLEIAKLNPKLGDFIVMNFQHEIDKLAEEFIIDVLHKSFPDVKGLILSNAGKIDITVISKQELEEKQK